MNAYHRLRAHNLQRSTRPFVARGASVARCERCLLGVGFCICASLKPAQAQVDFVLLMHHDEIFKPTNTGRLIADVMPENTYVFEWSRTEACAQLRDVLTDPRRQCALVFPAMEGDQRKALERSQLQLDTHRLTFILLDGTWRQASRMARLSPYLRNLPLVDVPPLNTVYSVRKAIREGQMSTAEAAGQLLRMLDQAQAATHLEDYFAQFNRSYFASRGRSDSDIP